jgi:oligoendopeptidase F
MAQDITTLAQRFQAVLDEPLTESCLPEWMQRWTGLQEEFEEYWIQCFENRQKDTRVESYKNDWNTFITVYQPQVRQISIKLKEKLLAFLSHNNLPITAPFLAAFVEEKHIHLAKTSHQYIEMVGLAAHIQNLENGLTIALDNTEITYSQCASVLLLGERTERQTVWQGLHTKLNQLYPESSLQATKAIGLAKQVAQEAGFTDFRSLYWSNKSDISAAESKNLHLAILDAVTPLKQKITAHKKTLLNLSDIFPWDESFDVGKDLEIFSRFTATEWLTVIVNRLRQSSVKLDKLLEGFNQNHYDIDLSPHKTNQGFAAYRPKSKQPFLFLNFRNSFRSFSTLCHELGHVMHYLFMLSHDTSVFDIPNDRDSFNENIAFLFELYILDLLGNEPDAIFPSDTLATLKFQKAMRFIDRMYLCSKIELFEHAIYGSENLENHAETYASLEQQYPSGVNWAGLEQYSKTRWIDARALGEPFTLGLYSRALIGTLVLYQQVRANGLEMVIPALTLPGALSDTERFAALGIAYPFSPKTIHSAMAELERLIPN